MKRPLDKAAATAARLEELEAENVLLRREIEHRVRNSLQVVASLVELSARSTAEPAAIAVLTELRTRMAAIGAVYRTLDDIPHRATVDMGETLHDLASQILSGQNSTVAPIKVEAAGVVLPLDDAMPVALMITEVLLAERLGDIPEAEHHATTIRLAREGNEATLIIHLTNRAKLETMPLLPAKTQILMQALARQLNGALVIDNDDGVERTVSMRFPIRNPELK